MASEVIERYVRLKETAEQLKMDTRHNEQVLSSVEADLAAEVAAQGGSVQVEMFGDQYTLTAEVKLTPLAFSAAVKKKLYAKQNGRCAAPRCSANMDIRHLEVDHIVPVSKGGKDHDANVQLLCSWCNKVKGDRDMEYLDQRLADVEQEGVSR